jgi:hypothetical protein
MSTPNETVEILYVDGSNDYSYEPNDGMTLRDWFAGKALQGWLASFGPDAECKPVRVAEFAYEVADAMLAARARKEDEQ